jgi:hypothetical protein
MRNIHLISAFAAALIAGMLPAPAQNQPKGQQPPPVAAARPYKPVAITPPAPITDASFESMRQQIGEAAKRKDRAALAKLVAAQGFFWERENGNGADKRKPGIDNLAAALGLNNKDSAGWDMLTGYADDPTASPSPGHKGAICAPADPAYNAKEFDELTRMTQTDVSEWAYPVAAGTDVLASTQPNAAVVEKLGLAFVRVVPDSAGASATYLRVVTPSGKAGYVAVDAIAPIGNDQICYVKDGGAWKIGGYIGGGEPQ